MYYVTNSTLNETVYYNKLEGHEREECQELKEIGLSCLSSINGRVDVLDLLPQKQLILKCIPSQGYKYLEEKTVLSEW